MADETSPSPTIHLTGRIVLDDNREVGDLWIHRGKVTLTRPANLTLNTITVDGWAIPGLTDVHCHVGLGGQGAVDRDTTREQALADRDSGVLVIRDAGSPGETRWVDDEIDLPRVIRSGRHIARPKRYIQHYALELEDPDDLATVVAEQARHGDGWVKLIGDWIDRSDGPDSDLAPLWNREQLVTAVNAAHRGCVRVTVHTFATEAIDDLLHAGVDCIEHGTGILPEHLDTLVSRGIPVTPTLLQIGQFEAIATQGDEKYPKFAARMRALYQRRYEQVRMLHEAGVQLLIGTDAGGTIGHGAIAAECAELVAAGIPAREVVAAASWKGRRFVGVADIIEGSSADLVVYPEDPRRDINVLAHPKAVILRGRRVV